MASEMTLQTPVLENLDECQENVAPEDSAVAGRLKDQQGRVDSYCSTNPSEESSPLSGSCTFSTAVLKSSSGDVKAKSQLSGIQSALTPILKILNIGNKSPLTKSMKSDTRLNLPYFTFNRTTACQKLAAGSGPHPKLDVSPVVGGLLGDKDVSVCWLDDETMPDVSLLDDTCDSTMHCLSSTMQSSKDPYAKGVGTPSRANAPLSWMDDRYFPEITLLDVTKDSELSPGGEISPAEVAQGDNLKNTPTVKLEEGGENVMQPRGSDINPIVELEEKVLENSSVTVTSLSLQSDACAGENTMKVSFTKDISMSSVESSRSSTGPQEEDVARQTSAEDKPCIHAANVTCDISSSSDVSAASQLSTQDVQVLTSSTSELHGEPSGAKNEKLPTSCDAEMTTKDKVAESDNNTYTVAQSSMNGTTNVNCTYEMSPSPNTTLDLSASANRVVDIDTKEQDRLATNESEMKVLKMNQNGSADKLSSSCDVQNGTFDQPSLQTSSESPGLLEAGLQNSTFNDKLPPKQNGTMNLSGTGQGDAPQDLPDITSEFSPDVKTSEAECRVSDDQSQPVMPMAEGPCGSLGHQSMESLSTLILDDSFFVKVHYLVTSTPMPDGKIVKSLCSEQNNGKIIGAQKKLYGDDPTKPAAQVPSDVPSNIVCDRKMFLRQPAAKSLLPPPRAPSHLLKLKPASTKGEGRRLEPSMAGLPMTRQRIQALKNTAGPDPAPEVSGISSSYNLRATAAGSKHPTGLLRPQPTGITSGIQRAARSLGPPLARSTDKLGGPTCTATNPVVKNCQAKKHVLNRVEFLPATKRKKIDAAVPVRTAEASASCDTASKARVLKPPTTSRRGLPPKLPAHAGCARCAELQEQLKMKNEEIKKLKEELEQKNNIQ